MDAALVVGVCPRHARTDVERFRFIARAVVPVGGRGGAVIGHLVAQRHRVAANVAGGGVGLRRRAIVRELTQIVVSEAGRVAVINRLRQLLGRVIAQGVAGDGRGTGELIQARHRVLRIVAVIAGDGQARAGVAGLLAYPSCPVIAFREGNALARAHVVLFYGEPMWAMSAT